MNASNIKRTIVKVVSVSFLAVWQAAPAATESDIADLLDQALAASTEQEIRRTMASIVAISTEESAAAFLTVLDKRVIPSNMRLLPYLNMLFESQTSPTIYARFAEALREVDIERMDRFEIALVAGLRAKAGETDGIQELKAEFRAASVDYQQWGYSNYLLRVLSKINANEASDFVVQTVLSSDDPALKLRTEEEMRKMNNPSSLRIMRGWDSVSSGDFDLIVAEHYLKSIIRFGDSDDKEFLDWLKENAQTQFHEIDYERFLRPLVVDATKQVSSTRIGALDRFYGKPETWILVLLVVVGGGVTIRILRRKSAGSSGR